MEIQELKKLEKNLLNPDCKYDTVKWSHQQIKIYMFRDLNIYSIRMEMFGNQKNLKKLFVRPI